MEIIEARKEDFPGIIALIEKVWISTYVHIVNHQQIISMQKERYNLPALLQQAENGERFYVAIQNEQVIGVVSFTQHVEGVKIPKLYVDSDVRKQNVGRNLLKSVEIFVSDNQLKYIELNVNRYNKALYFYRRYGFYIHSSVDIPYKEYWLNDYVMRLEV